MSHFVEKEIRDFLLNYFSQKDTARGLNAVEIDDDLDLLEAGIIDSLGVIEMISAVEEHFQITVDFERIDPAELTMLGSFCRCVAESAVSSASTK